MIFYVQISDFRKVNCAPFSTQAFLITLPITIVNGSINAWMRENSSQPLSKTDWVDPSLGCTSEG